MSEPILTVVVPCFNEEDVLQDTMLQLSIHLTKLIHEGLVHPKSKLLFVDDGSTDRTWDIIQEHSASVPFVAGLKLARNVGHQSALLAGLLEAKACSDCTISIDADLQDDISVMREFLLKYKEGCDVVYGVRSSRKRDTFFKRTTAICFYRFLRQMGADVVHNHADYRLLSRRALQALSCYEERNLFLRGIIPLLGFRSAIVPYERKERLAGESKYPLRKMLSFAFDGITSFSVTPIRLVTLLGFCICLCSLLLGGYSVLQQFIGSTVPGWTSLMLSIWMLGGAQLMGIGLIGEYVGKMYKEAKRRPRFHIEASSYAQKMELQEWMAPSAKQEEKTS
ncbi:glycosyltransferase family 2 protein [Ectobacillus ponti]|uniref:Glycosyltransferase family 2 protein n=1 Tax=Ectobacillus ponti TaxID=2961894 RepID=A0AA41X666_9BACI|nr:glycosyltransferase family 2 protein [Ectobacillus ponti]MCP8967369.1 glycosyltransferase family 2 protein [Ectobacillus ponti]